MAQAERVALEVEAVNLANQGGPAMAHGADKVAEAVALEVVPAEPVVAADSRHVLANPALAERVGAVGVQGSPVNPVLAALAAAQVNLDLAESVVAADSPVNPVRLASVVPVVAPDSRDEPVLVELAALADDQVTALKVVQVEPAVVALPRAVLIAMAAAVVRFAVAPTQSKRASNLCEACCSKL